MSVRRASLGAFLVVAMTAVAVMTLGSPAQAEPKTLLVSSSASGPFRGNLATPLFAGQGKLVPRGAASSTFYVRNSSQEMARTTVALVNRGRSNDFESALTFGVDIDGTAVAGTVPVPDTPDCRMVTTGPNIAPGGVQAVDISLAVADLPGQVGMNQAASLDFVVTLTQTGSNGWVEVCGEQAVAEVEVKGEEGNATGGGTTGPAGSSDDAPDCDRDVVVTALGAPTCVPTAVDAGATYEGPPRGPREIAVLAGVLIATGAGMVLLAGLRRRRTD